MSEVPYVYALTFNDKITNMSLDERANWLHTLMPQKSIQRWKNYLETPTEMKGGVLNTEVTK